MHKTANVLDALPKSAQPAAKNAIADIYNAEDKDQARTAVKAFAKQYGAKFPKSVAKVVDDEDVLLAFYDYPAEHWIHLRTTNPIESTFSTVRLRTKVTRGAGSRSAALAMTFKLIEVRPGTLARGQCAAPGRPRASRSPLQARRPRRTGGRQRGLSRVPIAGFDSSTFVPGFTPRVYLVRAAC